MEPNTKTELLDLRQDGFIERIVKSLGLDNVVVTKNHAPSKVNNLVQDEDGPPDNGQLNYSTVVGMMMY